MKLFPESVIIKTIFVFSDKDGGSFGGNCSFVVDRIHPGLINLFLSEARNEYEKTQEEKPSIRKNLNKQQNQKFTEPTSKKCKKPEL